MPDAVAKLKNQRVGIVFSSLIRWAERINGASYLGGKRNNLYADVDYGFDLTTIKFDWSAAVRPTLIISDVVDHLKHKVGNRGVVRLRKDTITIEWVTNKKEDLAIIDGLISRRKELLRKITKMKVEASKLESKILFIESKTRKDPERK